MVFSSGIFLFLFLPVLLIAYYNPICRKRWFLNLVLFMASVFFYAWGEPVFVFVMLFSVFLNWGFGILISRSREWKRKLLFVTILIWNIGLLFVYKYLGFFAENLGILLHSDSKYFSVSIALPIGISFFTFQILSYIIDVYRAKVSAEKNPLYVGLYITMFPQLVAGPIVRYETIANEIRERKENWNDFSSGLTRFVIGMAKKMLLANYLGQLADYVWGIEDKTVLLAWIGAIAYTFQIYYDFSGYSDMAIGLGRMFGFHFEENFNYPYISKSITEFWRRWHMSLSQWFRDYVYIPLGGSRVGNCRRIFNLFVVWLLTGIWHGANWTFICWGLFYFVLLVIEKFGKADVKKGVSHIYTLFFVILAWVLFRADSLSQALTYWGNLFGIGTHGFMDEKAVLLCMQYKWMVLAAAVGATPLAIRAGQWIKAKSLPFYEIGKSLFIVILFGLSVMAIAKNTYNPFIYFNF